ncbi:MAG: hypothetical protein NXH97_04305 [Rhodobacteraceae bacterium]|nr:hypothetical protein [Paracoccaceae bacterium]
MTLDPTIFTDASELENDEVVGRLNITSTLGNKDREGDCDVLHTFGGHSLSIRDAEGNLAYGGDDMLEQLSARFAPWQVNAHGDGAFDFDNRLDNEGPEPETVAITGIEGRQVARSGTLERAGPQRCDWSDCAGVPKIDQNRGSH